MTVRSAELAALANKRAVADETKVSGELTRFWRYRSPNKSAQTIIFIHGYRGNHHGLEAIAGALPDFNIVIPDLPGFGQSAEFAGDHSVENYSIWLAGFIANLELSSPPVLLGHSFGTIICAQFAATHPELSQLILVNPVSAPALQGPKGLLTKVATGFLWLSANLPLRQGKWLLQSWPMVRGMSVVMTKTKDAKLRKWVHAQHDQHFSDFASRRVVLEAYQASISHHVGEYSSRFNVPTLLITGLQDDITSPAQQRAMAKTMTCEWALIEHRKVGHLTHYEIPDLVASDVRAQLLSENHAD